MQIIKMGVLRETKTPPDFRVVLSPEKCADIVSAHPEVQLTVQPSDIRRYQNEEYSSRGIYLNEDLSGCDILLGVKEVKKETLIPGKTYFFFSHTIKKQPHNAALLKAVLEKKIRLIDYELIKDSKGKRLIGFGRYAGIVGCYNGFRLYGLKHGLFSIKPAHECADRTELQKELKKVKLPKGMKIVLTGFGRVGNGAVEILSLLNLRRVEVSAFLNESFDEPVYCHPDSADCFRRIADNGFDKREFYTEPELYESAFTPFCHTADMFVACHYWQKGSPNYFTAEDAMSADWKVSVVADVSCDVGGPVGTTLRSSSIAIPFYGFNRQDGSEVDFMHPEAVAVMAIDNLPCELPRDASDDFASEFANNVLPELLNGDANGILKAATITNFEGHLNEAFVYLEEYAANG